MAVSQYFNNYGSLNEQRVIEDIIVESIKIMGFDAFYIPNNNAVARDLLYGEDPVKKFGTAYPLEMYLSSSMEYSGEREFFSKFGLEIKNNVQVVLSKRSFSKRVPNTIARPTEGDLVYIPFLNGTGELFEIKFTNQTKDFFMLGRKVPYFYELEMEKFKYSQEIVDTGIPDIDVVVTNSAYTITFDMGAGTGNYIGKEIVYQSPDNTFANASAVAIAQTWNKPNKVLTVTNVAGEFQDSNVIIGQSSNAQYTLTTYDPLGTSPENEVYDNLYINTQAGDITDFSETNPFGSI